MAMRDVGVVILAGGRGTRLQSLPGDLPKPLRPVNGRPFVTFLIDQVRRAGARRIVLSLGWKPESFDALLRSDPDLVAVVEPEPLGTGGGLRNALPRLEATTWLVLNGDSYADADLVSLVDAHRTTNAAATILLRRVEDAARYGRVELGPSNAVTGFSEKGAGGAALINAGIYAVERTAVESIPAGRAVSLEREVFPGWTGGELFGHPASFPFIDIGTPDSYRDAGRFFSERAAP